MNRPGMSGSSPSHNFLLYWNDGGGRVLLRSGHNGGPSGGRASGSRNPDLGFLEAFGQIRALSFLCSNCRFPTNMVLLPATDASQRLRQETLTARIEVVDAVTERLLLLQSLPFFGHDADVSGVPSGPGPQPLRGMPGFPAQQQAQARNATLASARLPNGKLGAMILNRCRFEQYTELRKLMMEDEQGPVPIGISTCP